MRSFKVLGHQAKYIGAAFVMLVATFTPLLVTTTASAAQLTQRSVELSSSSEGATGVVYSFNFTAAATAGGVVVQFCSNTPLMLESCTAPSGFSSATVTGGGGATVLTDEANLVTVTKAVSVGANSFTLTGITNPTAASTIFARIITYVDDTDTANYTTTAFGTDKVDDGSVAISITDTIGVAGSVLEALTFCVSGTAITTPCTTGLTAPTLELGEDVGGGVIALTSAISTGDIFSQVSTNAVGGAVVRLKTSNTCGGLARPGQTVCDIAAAGSSDWTTTGQAKFGVMVDDTETDLAGSTGTFVSDAAYTNTGYRLNFDDNDVTGVTSPYGDPILNTDGDPATGQNAKLTFGAAIAPNTPAGRYSASLSLVATGTF